MCSSLKITKYSSHSKFQTSAAAIQEPIGSTSATTMALDSLPMTWIRQLDIPDFFPLLQKISLFKSHPRHSISPCSTSLSQSDPRNFFLGSQVVSIVDIIGGAVSKPAGSPSLPQPADIASVCSCG